MDTLLLLLQVHFTTRLQNCNTIMKNCTVCICLKVIIRKNIRKLGQDFHSFATCILAVYAVSCMQYEFSLNENIIILSPITLGGTRNETEKGFKSQVIAFIYN